VLVIDFFSYVDLSSLYYLYMMIRRWRCLSETRAGICCGEL